MVFKITQYAEALLNDIDLENGRTSSRYAEELIGRSEGAYRFSSGFKPVNQSIYHPA